MHVTVWKRGKGAFDVLIRHSPGEGLRAVSGSFLTEEKLLDFVSREAAKRDAVAAVSSSAGILNQMA